MTITNIQLIRRPEVIKLSGRSKSALFLDEQSGLIPPAISIGDRAVAYLKHEIETVIQARIEGKTNEQIKALVQELIEQRKKIA